MPSCDFTKLLKRCTVKGPFNIRTAAYWSFRASSLIFEAKTNRTFDAGKHGPSLSVSATLAPSRDAQPVPLVCLKFFSLE